MTHLDHPILNQAVRYILDGPHLSVLATTDADGKPHPLQHHQAAPQDDQHEPRSRVNLLIHGLPVDRPNDAGDGPNYATI